MTMTWAERHPLMDEAIEALVRDAGEVGITSTVLRQELVDRDLLPEDMDDNGLTVQTSAAVSRVRWTLLAERQEFLVAKMVGRQWRLFITSNPDDAEHYRLRAIRRLLRLIDTLDLLGTAEVLAFAGSQRDAVNWTRTMRNTRECLDDAAAITVVGTPAKRRGRRKVDRVEAEVAQVELDFATSDDEGSTDLVILVDD
jgi:hypothetical protein